MARIRTVKPEFFRHEGLQDLEAAHPGSYVMLVFEALWGHCDKAGRFEWKPRTLKLDILPFLPFDMADTLNLLAEAGFIRTYTVDGKQYGEVPTFAEHQRISGKEAQEPEKHPGSNGEAPKKTCLKESAETGEAGGKQSPGQEGKGREGNGEAREANRSQGSRLSPDWSLPADWRAWAKSERPDLDVDREAQCFADYWHGAAGSKGRKADWEATWRNWIRRAETRGGGRNGAAPREPSKLPDLTL